MRTEEERLKNYRARNRGVVDALIAIDAREEGQKAVAEAREGFRALQLAFDLEDGFLSINQLKKAILLEDLLKLTKAAQPRGFWKTRDESAITIPDVDAMTVEADARAQGRVNSVQVAGSVIPGESTELTITPRPNQPGGHQVGAPTIYRKLTYYPGSSQVNVDFGDERTFVVELNAKTKEPIAVTKPTEPHLILLPGRNEPNIFRRIDQIRLRRL